ncbi:TIGR03749 family integrating conjugative element protein [Billgrantia desiderata]|jgi:integrating conjugative element protein (TIGR03749 family)|uniref:TIGR03749 family integrating conjugative element protein n=1 Tax=Billgrantia desiderata TaxID=52021 RepID=UPI00089EFB3E|nr:TIGR03749 family integrating conjugative element protein [Halomonas desiderata]MCE8013911.1 TIGR03749 family integrating conjugative element protein [Halomonas desiderata]SEG30243.1 integrating conjugative element protein, PFL_4704 family [Halomonas desiderata]
MKRITAVVGVMLLCLLSPLAAWALEIMEWDRRPLAIALPVGTERVVQIDRNVRVGLPAPIASVDVLRVQSTGGMLYLLAHDAFDVQRVQLQDVESGEILLVDLSASDDASDEDIRIVDAPPRLATSGGRAGVASAPASAEAQHPVPGAPVPVALVRHAAQSLYSPLRAIESLPGVRRTPMQLPETLPNLINTLPLRAEPIGAWTLDGHTVTAVRLVNTDVRGWELDPRYIQCDCYSATFMHQTLGPRGSAEDTTTVFLVTQGGRLRSALLLPLATDAGEGG